MSFSSNKAPGIDKVSMSVIKDALPCILPILTQIVHFAHIFSPLHVTSPLRFMDTYGIFPNHFPAEFAAQAYATCLCFS